MEHVVGFFPSWHTGRLDVTLKVDFNKIFEEIQGEGIIFI
jgi:hypothetical protein